MLSDFDFYCIDSELKKTVDWDMSVLESSQNEFDVWRGYSQGMKNRVGIPVMPCFGCLGVVCDPTADTCVSTAQYSEKNGYDYSMVIDDAVFGNCTYCTHDPKCRAELKKYEQLSCPKLCVSISD